MVASRNQGNPYPDRVRLDKRVRTDQTLAEDERLDSLAGQRSVKQPLGSTPVAAKRVVGGIEGARNSRDVDSTAGASPSRWPGNRGGSDRVLGEQGSQPTDPTFSSRSLDATTRSQPPPRCPRCQGRLFPDEDTLACISCGCRIYLREPASLVGRNIPRHIGSKGARA